MRPVRKSPCRCRRNSLFIVRMEFIRSASFAIISISRRKSWHFAMTLRHPHLRVLRETGDQRGEQFRRVRQSLHVMSYCYPYCQRLLLQVKAQRHRLLRVNFSLLRQRFYTSSCFDASNRRRRSAPPSRATLGTPATPSTRPDRWNCSVVVEEYTLQQTDSSARN